MHTSQFFNVVATLQLLNFWTSPWCTSYSLHIVLLDFNPLLLSWFSSPGLHASYWTRLRTLNPASTRRSRGRSWHSWACGQGTFDVPLTPRTVDSSSTRGTNAWRRSSAHACGGLCDRLMKRRTPLVRISVNHDKSAEEKVAAQWVFCKVEWLNNKETKYSRRWNKKQRFVKTIFNPTMRRAFRLCYTQLTL